MASTTGLQGTQLQAKTRVLLTLWDMEPNGEKVKKSELTQKSKRSVRGRAGNHFPTLPFGTGLATFTASGYWVIGPCPG